MGVVALLIYNSTIQTYAANMYVKSLAKKLSTNILIEKVNVDFFNEVNLHNVYVEDLKQDTLFYAKNIKVDIGFFSYKTRVIEIDKATVSDAFFNLKKYKNDTITNLQFLIDHFKSDSEEESSWGFAIDKTELKNVRFNYFDFNQKKQPYGVDFNHLSLKGVNTKLSDIKLIDEGVDCNIEYLSLMDQSGFAIDTLSAQAQVAPSGIVAQNLKLITPNSDIDGNITFLTEEYASLANFIEAVKIKSFFQPTKLNFKDISYFAPGIEGVDKWINFNGEIKGTVDNLKTRKFSFITDDGTRFRGKTDISGLPNIEDMFMHIDVKEFITTKEKVETFPFPPFKDRKTISLPDNFRHLGAVRFKGNFTGFYHDFVAYGTVKTSLGSVSTDVSLKLKDNKSTYTGKVKTDHFNLGKFFEVSKNLGTITMDVSIDGQGFTKEDIDATISGKINQVVVNGYEYNNVDVEGDFKNKVFEGYLAVKDENIEFDFNGNVNLANETPEYHFISNINNAKLAKLNLIDSRKKLKTRFSATVGVNLKGDHPDNFVGDIKILNANYQDLLDTIIVDSTMITSVMENDIRKINMFSGLLDAELKGKFYFAEIGKFVNNFFVRYIPSQLDKSHQITNLSHDIDFNVHLHNSDLLSKIFFKKVDLSDHTIIDGHYNAQEHVLTIKGNSPFIDAYGMKIHHVNLNTQTNENKFNFNLTAQKIAQNDSITIHNFNVESFMQYDSAQTSISWGGTEDSVQNNGDINIVTRFEGFNSITGRFNSSRAYIAGKLWSIKPNNFIVIDTSMVQIKSLAILSKSQEILVDGKLSDNPSDQIDALLTNFDLGTLKNIIPSGVVELDGIVNGVASVTKKDNELLYTSDLEFDKFRLNRSLIGKGSLEALWNSASQALKINGKFYRDHIPTILFNGYYYLDNPNDPNQSFDLTLQMHQTELSMFNEYIKDDISNLKGVVNANVKLTGNAKQPSLNGQITMQNASFTVNYLNTFYVAKHCQINIVPDMISFDNVEITDAKNNKAYANGTIFHTWFKDISIDVGLDAHNFFVLNTTELDNSLYHGKAYVTGFVDIGGYDKNLIIDADIKTEKNTVINIPLSDNQELEESTFIKFVDKDSSNIKVEKHEDVDLTNIDLNFDMDITPDAQVRLVFDDKIGDVMRSTGSGHITLNVNNDGDLNMFGNYVIKDGDYLFTLQNVINKRFDIEEGGIIKWTGSPYDAEIDITAVYRLRARLYDLLINVDTSDVYKKRIPVDLKLRMQNEMMNPDISFDIVLPTADEDTKSKVRSVLYVSDREENIQELNKQVFSLLVLNSFISPPGADAGYGHAGVGATTSSELLSNQLSNWLSKISNDFDIGLNYRPGDELTSDEVELAVSTQFINDRFVLDANFGVGGEQNVSSTSTQNSNNLLGDVTIEYKISKDGKLRAKAFNNSNQFSFTNNNSAYTQGLGLSYKEEYDTGKEFWQKFFGRFRRKKQKKKK